MRYILHLGGEGHIVRQIRRGLIRSAGLVVLLCTSAPGWPEAATQAQHARREVLPQGMVPVDYELALAPDADALTFSGRVTITIDVSVADPSVTLNASGLTFDHATLDAGPDAR